MTEGSVGFDVCSADDLIILNPKVTLLISLGFKLQIPKGYWAMLVPRSSLQKHNIIMPNSIGVIDEDYRLEVKMPLRNIGTNDHIFSKYDRIGQLIILPKLDVAVVQGIVESTNRGGFGSTS